MNKMPKDNAMYLAVVLLVTTFILSAYNCVSIMRISNDIRAIKDTLNVITDTITESPEIDEEVEKPTTGNVPAIEEESVESDDEIEDEEEVLDDVESEDFDEEYISEKYAFVNEYITENQKYNSSLVELDIELFVYSDQVCQKYDVSPYLMWAIYRGESGFQVDVTSLGGTGDCRGLGQLKDSTGVSMWNYLGYDGEYSPQYGYDPYINVDLTTALVRYHMDRNNNDMDTTLKSYLGSQGSAGEAYVAKVKGNAASLGINLDNPLYN